jgi:hypothetical protein
MPPEPNAEEDGPPERDWHIVLQPNIKTTRVSVPVPRFDDPATRETRLESRRSTFVLHGERLVGVISAEAAITRRQTGSCTPSAIQVRGPKTWWMFYWWTWQGAKPQGVAASPRLLRAKRSRTLAQTATRNGEWLTGTAM